jgi:hypothetical protein
MSYYNNFDANCYSEDFMAVTPEEQEEVFRMIAEENEALNEMPQDEQTAWEHKQDRLKNWLGGYSPITDGDTYEGIAI